MSDAQNPFAARFAALRLDFENVYRDSTLHTLAEEIAEMSRKVVSLPGEIERVRSRGYVFASYLEQKAGVLAQHWEAARREAGQSLEGEASRLRSEMERLRKAVDRVEMQSAKVGALERDLPDLENEVRLVKNVLSDAQSRVRASYSRLSSDVSQTLSQLSNITWILDQRDEAAFPFLAEEGVFLAAKAEWQASGRGKDDPDGILYLTDQRLVFEQKETTGKKLGLFGGKKTQELEWEIPLHQIESVTAENKGLFGGKDLLHFTFKSGAPLGQTTVEVKGGVQCKFWAAQIERMTQGDVNDERAIQPDPEVLESLRSAPTACPSCGGTLPQMVANQRQIACDYCGAVIRV
ncbi:MAG: hypothetical protein JNL42_13185 [Anaerolineae bacterium]|nr:hypothetical protein [Anaerolineae bacterium]